jgi:hypothetical protein
VGIAASHHLEFPPEIRYPHMVNHAKLRVENCRYPHHKLCAINALLTQAIRVVITLLQIRGQARSVVVRLPEPWNCLLSFNIYFKKSLKVTQSPRVPRVRGGDPSGVAPGKLEGFFSASGHPWKPFS